MIELISVTNNNVKHFAAVGITAAELPVKDLGTGSTCMMLDTGKKYVFFEGNESWYEDSSGSGGGGGGDVKEMLSIDPEMVNFIDYDGTVVEQWSLDSLQKKTELPAFPEHAGLTAQGWNWTLEDIQDFGKPNVVGMLYVTDDGWSRFYLDIAERKEIVVSVGVSGTQEIEIDWGDGTKETVTVEYSRVLKHVYPSSREFIFRMNGNGVNYNISYIRFYDPVTGDDIRNTYYGIVRKIESGQGLGFYSSAFYYAISLETVSFSEELVMLGAQAFAASGLKAAVLPKGITNLSNSVFNEAKWLEAVSLPGELVKLGSKAFCKCQNLGFAVIPDMVTTIDASDFSDCSMLEAVVLGDAISSGGGALFSACMNLRSVVLPDGLTQLPSQILYYCASLQKVTVGSKVTAISNTAFSACKVLKEIIFLATDPPVGASGMFGDVAAGFAVTIKRVNEIVRGWINYFRIGMMKLFMEEFGEWLRHKIRVIVMKQWKRPQTIYRNLSYLNWKYKIGCNKEDIFKVATSRLGWYRRCGMSVVNFIISKDLLENRIKDGAGLLNPLSYYLVKVGI